MLLKNISQLTLANTVLALAMFGLISGTGHLMGAAAVGHLTYLNGLVAPAMVLAQFALRQNYVSAPHVPPFVVVRQARFWLSLGMFAALALAAMFVTETPWLALTLLGLAGWRFAENMSDIYYAHGQRLNRFGAMSKSIMLRALLGVGGFLLTLWATQSLWAAATVFALAGWAVVLLFDGPKNQKMMAQACSQKPSETTSTAPLRPLILASIPLTFALFTSSLTFSVPRFYMNHFDTAFNLGILGAMMSLVWMAGIVVNAIGQALLPTQSQHWQRREYKRFAKKVFFGLGLVWASFAVGFVALELLGDWAMATLFGPDFVGYKHVFRVVALGGLAYFTGQMLIYATTAARIFKGMVFAACASAFTAVVAGALLIPPAGLLAAASGGGMMGAAFTTVALGAAASITSVALLVWHAKVGQRANA